MSYKYFPHTDSDVSQMLAAAGAKSLDELYCDVPEQLRFRGDYALPSTMSEVARQLKVPLVSSPLSKYESCVRLHAALAAERNG